MNKEIKRHLGNISRSVGHDISSHRYSYIISESDLINAWLQMHNDLNYTLLTDSKYHRALVFNKPGLEKYIQENLIKQMEQNFNELSDIVTRDLEMLLNNLIQTKNGTISITKSNNSKHDTLNLWASAAAKGIVKGIADIMDDIMNYEDDKRR